MRHWVLCASTFKLLFPAHFIQSCFELWPSDTKIWCIRLCTKCINAVIFVKICQFSRYCVNNLLGCTNTKTKQHVSGHTEWDWGITMSTEHHVLASTVQHYSRRVLCAVFEVQCWCLLYQISCLAEVTGFFVQHRSSLDRPVIISLIIWHTIFTQTKTYRLQPIPSVPVQGNIITDLLAQHSCICIPYTLQGREN